MICSPEKNGVGVSGWRAGWAILKPTEGTALTQAVKHRSGRRLERDPQAGAPVRAAIGAQAALPCTVHLDRLHGALRDRPTCLTRKTHAFAKEVDTWDALFSLALFEHDWLRPHIARRIPLREPHDTRRYHQRTPAMALHLTDHPRTWQDFLLLRLRQC